MTFNIVLVEPEIPNNTGNIGRLSLASGSVLHLVKPFGFELSDARLKRAGLDYWKHITVKIYESLDEFLAMNKNKDMVFSASIYSPPSNRTRFVQVHEETTGCTLKLTVPVEPMGGGRAGVTR